ncbi:MAG TPA: transcription/translation regulatory transformer protein RfaH [Gammaproteobacteria bacterium]|nr:transcription/translation regulatory transformer protein RfaH [Gammaproteobacteria bacterium]
MRAWYLIHSKPHQERIARENLQRQSYEVYLPLMHQRVRRRNRAVDQIVPMFPRYLFIHLDDQTDNWKPIRSTLGVARMVSFGNAPAIVPIQLINQLQAREGADGVHSSPAKKLARGSKVRIIDGALAGYEAIFEAQNGRERVTLLLQIAGQPVPVHLREIDIEPLN